MVFLVTGGAGFIGSHLCQTLGNNCKSYDNYSTGNNYEFLKSLGITQIKGDVCDRKELGMAFKGVETVYHLAAMNRAQRSIQNPVEANEVNVTGTINVLEECRKNDSAIVFVSSSSVYGGGEDKKAEDSKTKPLHPYGVGKLSGEEYCRVYGELYGLKETRLRYVSVFGPRQRPDVEYAAVIPKFINAIKTNKPVPIFGDGSQTRQFTFVKDTVEATIQASRNNKSRGACFNVASSESTSVLELIKIIEEMTGKKALKQFLPVNKGEPLHNPIDVSKIKRVLGWQAKHTTKQGIKEMIEYL
jgi:UDP-glucose 4-epimerase